MSISVLQAYNIKRILGNHRCLISLVAFNQWTNEKSLIYCKKKKKTTLHVSALYSDLNLSYLHDSVHSEYVLLL